MNKCPFAVCRAKWLFPRRSLGSSTGTQLIAPALCNKATLLIWRAALGATAVSPVLGDIGVSLGRGEPSPGVQLCPVETPPIPHHSSSL